MPEPLDFRKHQDGWHNPLHGSTRMSTRHTSTPKGRFVLRADSIRPYSCGGKAADGSTISRPLLERTR